VYPLIQPDCEWSDEVTDTDRGDKGFGSSDNLGLPPYSKRVRDVSNYPDDNNFTSHSGYDTTGCGHDHV